MTIPSDWVIGLLTIACVRQGDKYGWEYVERIRSMAARHIKREFRVVCFTDRPDQCPAGIVPVDTSAYGLPGWWSKMLLFSPALRGPGRVVYFDLDTVICGPLDPLLDLDVDFGICANFTRARNPTYRCRYGSCVMTFREEWGRTVFDAFAADTHGIRAECGSHGDQMAIEMLHPDAVLLQDHTPPGFFIGRREIGPVKPPGCSVVAFAGRHKPHNAQEAWIKQKWR